MGGHDDKIIIYLQYLILKNIFRTSEEDIVAEAEHENWENILTNSGPTTFTAQFSIKIP